jgi:hypothetical protein
MLCRAVRLQARLQTLSSNQYPLTPPKRTNSTRGSCSLRYFSGAVAFVTGMPDATAIAGPIMPPGRGWQWVRGLLSFYVICSIGGMANVGIASFIFAAHQAWWVAGLSGALVSAIWNYTVSAFFTWTQP